MKLFWISAFGTALGMTLTKIPPMPDIDQISTDEEWNAMMEEYEAVQALRGAILRGEISLEDATSDDAVAVPEAPAAPAEAPAAPAVEAAAPAAPASSEDAVAARQEMEAVGNKVDEMMNANSDEEWNKMMEAYNNALAAHPVA